MDISKIAELVKGAPRVQIPDHKKAAEAICKHLLTNSVLVFCNQVPYLRRLNWYQAITDQDATGVVTNLLRDDDLIKIPARCIPEALNRIRCHPKLQVDIEGEFRRRQFEINLQNGVYNLLTQELCDHSPNDCFDYILDFNYTPHVSIDQTRAFREFLHSSLSDDELPCLLRTTGYAVSSLVQGNKAFLFHGKSGTGKSTYLNFLSAVIPKELISTIRFSEMAKETYKPAYIGKRVNISRETDQTPMRNEDGFKSLVSCEETSGRLLYHNVQTIHSHAKFMFASNNDLNIPNADDAVYNRFVVIRFTKPITKKNSKLETELIEEKDYIMSMAVDSLKELVESNYDFQMSEAGLSYIRQKKAELHITQSFAEERLTVDNNSNVSHSEVFDAFKKWCTENGVDDSRVKRNTFYNELRGYYPSIRDGKVNNVHAFIGIGFKGTTEAKTD